MTLDESPDSHEEDLLPIIVAVVAVVVVLVAFFLICRFFWKRYYRELFSLSLAEEENTLPSCRNTLKTKQSRRQVCTVESAEAECSPLLQDSSQLQSDSNTITTEPLKEIHSSCDSWDDLWPSEQVRSAVGGSISIEMSDASSDSVDFGGEIDGFIIVNKGKQRREPKGAHLGLDSSKVTMNSHSHTSNSSSHYDTKEHQIPALPPKDSWRRPCLEQSEASKWRKQESDHTYGYHAGISPASSRKQSTHGEMEVQDVQPSTSSLTKFDCRTSQKGPEYRSSSTAKLAGNSLESRHRLAGSGSGSCRRAVRPQEQSPTPAISSSLSTLEPKTQQTAQGSERYSNPLQVGTSQGNSSHYSGLNADQWSQQDKDRTFLSQCQERSGHLNSVKGPQTTGSLQSDPLKTGQQDKTSFTDPNMACHYGDVDLLKMADPGHDAKPYVAMKAEIRRPPKENVPEVPLVVGMPPSDDRQLPVSASGMRTEHFGSSTGSPAESAMKYDGSHASSQTPTTQWPLQRQLSYPGDSRQSVKTIDSFAANMNTSTSQVQKVQEVNEPTNVSDPFLIEDYATTEWKGSTAKAEKMLRGYRAIPEYVERSHLRRIRGDNYCAIRASVFQALVTQLPILNSLSRNYDLRQIPRRLLAQNCHWLYHWSFANRMPHIKDNAVIVCLEDCLSTLSGKVKCANECLDSRARLQYVLSEFNGDNKSIDFALMEATKLLMLEQAVQLYNKMQCGGDVPVWVFILFARDTSPDPQKLMINHLNKVGDTGGLEQVEMFLLGYTFQATLQVFRPSQIDAEDFVSRYPDDLGDESPMLPLVAEDDRHYNIIATHTYLNQVSSV